MSYLIIATFTPMVMTKDVHGFCLKCKKYGVINNLKYITMKNGRRRAAGHCSVKHCKGKVSKIVS